MAFQDPIAILGGTGKEGKGLAARWGSAGRQVAIGSRDLERARQAAHEVTALCGGTVEGMENRVAGESGALAVLTMPFDGMEGTLLDCRDALRGKLVVSAVNPLVFDQGRIRTREIFEGSAAERAAALLPESRVGAAFHNISAAVLLDLERAIDEDIPVAADAEADRDTIVALCQALGARGVATGPLGLARYLEGFTAVLLSVNRLHHREAGIRFTRLN